MSDTKDIRGTWAVTARVPATTIEKAVCRLRNAIILGELQPGQKLVEAALCRMLSVSRASLREALRALEAERLIILVPNRGPSVAKLDLKEIEDIHEVWAMLTGEAVFRFAAVARPAEVEALQDALSNLRAALAGNAPFEELAATNKFFWTIISHCGNDVLKEVVLGLVARINFLRAQILLREGWAELYGRELEEIVEAVRSNNPEAARQATRRHIASACTAARRLSLTWLAKPTGRRRSAAAEPEPVAEASPAVPRRRRGEPANPSL